MPIALHEIVQTSLSAFWRACRGFSATEVTTILTAITILSGMAAPAVSDYVEDAKLVRARSDVRTIAVSLVRLLNDVGPSAHATGGWATTICWSGPGSHP